MPVYSLTVLLVFAAAIVIAFVLAIFFRRNIRRFFIGTAEIFVLFANIVFVIFCGLYGSIAFQMVPLLASFGFAGSVPGFILGALAGFVVSAIFSAVFFLLVEISDNSKRTVSFFERMSSRRSDPSL